MTLNPFEFLFGLSDEEAANWLKSFLLCDATTKSNVLIPDGRKPVDHIIFVFNFNEVSAVKKERFSNLVAMLLENAVLEDNTCNSGSDKTNSYFEDILHLACKFPLPDRMSEPLYRVATSPKFEARTSLKYARKVLWALRANAPTAFPISPLNMSLRELWEEKIDDPNFADIAIETFFDMSKNSAIRNLPRALRTLVKAGMPVVDMLTAIEIRLGIERIFWQRLAWRLKQEAELFAVIEREWPDSSIATNLVAIDAFQSPPQKDPDNY